MRTNRKRCLFCRELVADLKEHITARHFPRHCTFCLKTMESHPKTLTSPTLTCPCPGGMFVPGESR